MMYIQVYTLRKHNSYNFTTKQNHSSKFVKIMFAHRVHYSTCKRNKPYIHVDYAKPFITYKLALRTTMYELAIDVKRGSVLLQKVGIISLNSLLGTVCGFACLMGIWQFCVPLLPAIGRIDLFFVPHPVYLGSY